MGTRHAILFLTPFDVACAQLKTRAFSVQVFQGHFNVLPHLHVLTSAVCWRYLQVAEKGADLLEQVQLTAAANKRSASYSGGMKRRLSVALALLGGPQMVFLDEPSTGKCTWAVMLCDVQALSHKAIQIVLHPLSHDPHLPSRATSADPDKCPAHAGCLISAGMDPISRRAVWDAINAAKQQAAVVLTTHSMEEADALGDRIAIMVRGRMRVLGGSLTLKQKYGNGYQVRWHRSSLLPSSQWLGCRWPPIAVLPMSLY